MEHPASLDPTDQRLVALLAANARLTFQQLGDAVGLSAPAAYQRVKKLERGGVVRGYHADVDRAALGGGIVAFLEIEAAQGHRAEQLLADWQQAGEALECHRMASGRFLTKVRVRDLGHLETLLEAARGAGARATAAVGIRTLFEHPAAAVLG